MSDGIWEGEYDARKYWKRKIIDLCMERDMEIPNLDNKFANKLEGIYVAIDKERGEGFSKY